MGDNTINGVKVPFVPIVPGEQTAPQRIRGGNQGSFGNIFTEELEKIKFSGHAQKRLETRNIQLSSNALENLRSAVERAEEKGAKDSLIMMDNTAFIVNIPNRTVVTALSLEERTNQVFTNIDSVVFA